MDIVSSAVGVRPQWDGQRVLFQTSFDGHIVSRSISRMALRDFMAVSSGTLFEPLACFAHNRGRIEGIAREKFLTQANPPAGRLHIWSEDIVDPSPSATPLGTGQVGSGPAGASLS